MDAIEDGNCLRVNIHVFARGDGRERVDAGVEEVRGRLTGDEFARSVGTHPSTVNWVYPCASTLTCAARESSPSSY